MSTDTIVNEAVIQQDRAERAEAQVADLKRRLEHAVAGEAKGRAQVEYLTKNLEAIREGLVLARGEIQSTTSYDLLIETLDEILIHSLVVEPGDLMEDDVKLATIGEAGGYPVNEA